jgi:hypothetical protein
MIRQTPPERNASYFFSGFFGPSTGGNDLM